MCGDLGVCLLQGAGCRRLTGVLRAVGCPVRPSAFARSAVTGGAMNAAARGCMTERRHFRGMGNKTGQSLPALVEEMYFYLKKKNKRKTLDNCFSVAKGKKYL